jgi:hypothetical protein
MLGEIDVSLATVFALCALERLVGCMLVQMVLFQVIQIDACHVAQFALVLVYMLSNGIEIVLND